MRPKDNLILGKHGIIYALGSLGQALLPFLLLPILTERMNPTEYGEYSLIFITATLFGSIFYLGMTSSLPRFYFEYDSKKERDAVYTTSVILILFGALIQISLSLLFGKNISNFLFNDFLHYKQIFWAFFANVLNFIILHFISYLRLRKQALKSVFCSFLLPIMSILFIFMVPNLNKNTDIVLHIFKVLALSNIVVLILLIPFLIKDFNFNKKIIFEEYKHILIFGLGSVLFAVSQYFFDLQDKLIVERIVGLETFGVYTATVRIASIANIILVTPFVFVWNPIMMESRKKDNVQNVFKLATNIYFTFAGLLLIPIFIFGPYLIEILIKSNFISISDLKMPLFIVSLGVLSYGLLNIFSAGLLYSKKVYMTTLVLIPLAAIKYLLGYRLIRIFGINGAAFSSFISTLLMVYIVFLISKRYFIIKLDFKVFKRLLIYLFFIFPFIILTQNIISNLTSDILLTLASIYFGLCYVYNSFNPVNIYSKMITIN